MRTRILALRAAFINGLVNFTGPIYRFLTKQKKDAWKYGIDDLRNFPTGSLGRELAAFLDEHGIELMPKFEGHDVYHILTGYGTSPEAESRMQWWLLGNRKYSFYTLGTVMVSIMFFPDQYGHFIRDYVKGSKVQKISDWDFESLLYANINMLRLNIRSAAPLLVSM